jgi:hypothetical protein
MSIMLFVVMSTIDVKDATTMSEGSIEDCFRLLPVNKWSLIIYPRISGNAKSDSS